LIRQKHLPYIFGVISAFSIAFRFMSYTAGGHSFVVNIHTLSCLDLFMVGGFLAFYILIK